MTNLDNVGDKAKGRISKRVLQEYKTRQIFRKANISYHPLWDSPLCFITVDKFWMFLSKGKISAGQWLFWCFPYWLWRNKSRLGQHFLFLIIVEMQLREHLMTTNESLTNLPDGYSGLQKIYSRIYPLQQWLRATSNRGSCHSFLFKVKFAVNLFHIFFKPKILLDVWLLLFPKRFGKFIIFWLALLSASCVENVKYVVDRLKYDTR